MNLSLEQFFENENKLSKNSAMKYGLHEMRIDLNINDKGSYLILYK